MDQTRDKMIDELLQRGNDSLKQMLVRAYDAGRLEGYEEARQALKVKVEAALDTPPSASKSTPANKGVVGRNPRAEPGSVRPAVLTVMANTTRQGIKAMELTALIHRAGYADIKDNTVRAMLNKLKGEGLTEKRGNLWYLTEAKRNGVDASNDTEGKMIAAPH